MPADSLVFDNGMSTTLSVSWRFNITGMAGARRPAPAKKLKILTKIETHINTGTYCEFHIKYGRRSTRISAVRIIVNTENLFLSYFQGCPSESIFIPGEIFIEQYSLKL